MPLTRTEEWRTVPTNCSRTLGSCGPSARRKIVFTHNVDKQVGWIAIFSSLGVAIAAAIVLAAAAPAQVQTDDTAVNLVSAASGKCLQPINQSHNQGDAVVQQTCNGSAA